MAVVYHHERCQIDLVGQSGSPFYESQFTVDEWWLHLTPSLDDRDRIQSCCTRSFAGTQSIETRPKVGHGGCVGHAAQEAIGALENLVLLRLNLVNVRLNPMSPKIAECTVRGCLSRRPQLGRRIVTEDANVELVSVLHALCWRIASFTFKYGVDTG